MGLGEVLVMFVRSVTVVVVVKFHVSVAANQILGILTLNAIHLLPVRSKMVASKIAIIYVNIYGVRSSIIIDLATFPDIIWVVAQGRFLLFGHVFGG